MSPPVGLEPTTGLASALTASRDHDYRSPCTRRDRALPSAPFLGSLAHSVRPCLKRFRPSGHAGMRGWFVASIDFDDRDRARGKPPCATPRQEALPVRPESPNAVSQGNGPDDLNDRPFSAPRCRDLRPNVRRPICPYGDIRLCRDASKERIVSDVRRVSELRPIRLTRRL